MENKEFKNKLLIDKLYRIFYLIHLLLWIISFLSILIAILVSLLISFEILPHNNTYLGIITYGIL